MLLLEGSSSVTALAFAPDGTTLAIGSANGMVRWWDGQDATPPQPCHLEAVQSLAYAPDGAYLVSGSADHSLQIRTSANQLVFNAKVPDPHGITSIAFVGARSFVFGIGERPGPIGRPKTMFLHQIGQPRWRPFPFPVVHGIRAIAGDAERRLAVWVTDMKQLHVQDITRQPTRPQPLRNDGRALALSPDGRWVAVASGWDVLLFDITAWPALPILVGHHKGIVEALAFGADSRTLYSGSWDQSVRAWDVERQLEKACYTWPVGRIAALAIAADGLRAAAAGDTGNVAIWDLDD